MMEEALSGILAKLLLQGVTLYDEGVANMMIISLLIFTLTGRSGPHSPERCSQLRTDDGNVGLLATNRPAAQPSLPLSLSLSLSPP